MRWSFAVLALCGCDQLFGIGNTVPIDGPPSVDAAPPPTCPVAGTAPVFREDLHQLPARRCYNYAVTASGTTAYAWCDSALASGPTDQPLMPVTVTMPTTYIFSAWVAPEANLLVVATQQAGPVTYHMLFDDYTSDGHGGWIFALESDVGDLYQPPSNPSAGPDRRAIVATWDVTLSAYAIVELTRVTGGWKELRRYSTAEVGIADPTQLSVTEPSLSADGKQLVFVYQPPYAQRGGGSGSGTTLPPDPNDNATYVFVAQRASLDDHFGPAQKIENVPAYVSSPMLTADCGRIYFSALDTVFYLKQ